MKEEKPQELRRDPRINARIDVEFRSGKDFVKAYSQNLSKGGIYIETETLPDPNALVELQLVLPQTAAQKKGAILLRARVVRLMTTSVDGRTIHKVALQFQDLSPDAENSLSQLYSQLSEA